MRLEPDLQGAQAVAQTDAAHGKLAEMETHAFAVVRDGHAAQARAILLSEEYEAQKRIYAAGTTRFIAHLGDYLNRTLRAERDKATLSIITVIIAFIVSLLVWLAAIRSLHRSHAALLTSNIERTQAEREKEWYIQSLRKAEARYQRIAANVPGMVYQFVLHPDGGVDFPV